MKYGNCTSKRNCCNKTKIIYCYCKRKKNREKCKENKIYNKFEINESQASRPDVLYYRRNAESETDIAANPTDPLNIITVSHDNSELPQSVPDTGGPTEAFLERWINIAGIFTTLTKGKSIDSNCKKIQDWYRQVLHWELGDPPLIARGDPIITFGPKPNGIGGFSYTNGARAYFSMLASNFSGTSVPEDFIFPDAIATCFSDNKGLVWTLPVVVTDFNNFPPLYNPPFDTLPPFINDKPAIWADKNPLSPFFGYVYEGWAFYDDPFNQFVLGDFQFTRSLDGGETFSTPIFIPTPGLFFPTLSNRAFTTLPDGTLIATFLVYDFIGFFMTGILITMMFVTISKDGGQTFTPVVEIAKATDPPFRGFEEDDPYAGLAFFPGTLFRIFNGPNIASNIYGDIFITFFDYINNHAILKLAVSRNSGLNWTLFTVVDDPSINIFFPVVETFKQQVLIAFSAVTVVPEGTIPRAGVTSVSQFFIFSNDRGFSFTDKIKASNASFDPAGTAAGGTFAFQFLGDYNGLSPGPDGTFHYTWTDARNAVPCPAVDNYRVSLFNKIIVPQPNINDSCSPDFGNGDAFVSSIKPQSCDFKTKGLISEFITIPPISQVDQLNPQQLEKFNRFKKVYFRLKKRVPLEGPD